ncbi:DUF4856 domain-containing protein [Litorilituus sediminis]|nr:DUF4856 domain-containing protein [Litorilituus sediminis]
MEFKRKALAIAVMVATSTLTACGGSSSSSDPDPVTPENKAPTAVTLTANTVEENAMGVEVGTLAATDADSGDTHTFTTDNASFVIDGTTLSLAADASFDFEKMASVDVDVTVTDNGGLSHTETLTINVTDLLDYYDFVSEFDAEKSSVSYSGQTARHALIAELKNYIGNGGLQSDVDNGELSSKEEIVAKLNSFYDRDENAWDGFAVTFTDAKQKFFSEISSYKSLKDKVAGNDASGQHALWNGESNEAGQYTGENIAFTGWSTWDDAPAHVPADGVIPQKTPHGLVQQFFSQIADNAMENPGGKRYIHGAEQIEANEIPVFVNYDGTDLNQLIQKFLLMAVTYSQATDDYLDENKGLATDNTGRDKGEKDYTKLEHQFDEGFGYFGAARNYLDYSDNEIAGKVKTEEDGRADWNGKHDTDGDGEIDLFSEFNFGASVNAAKRDRGSEVQTDFTKEAMDAFLAGRKLINDAAGTELTTEQMAELLEYRDAAVLTWEKAIAATVVHYINDLRGDLDKLKAGADDYSFTDLAKHFSEMKGFALGLQFNPYSKITDEQFVEINTLFKDAPVTELSEIDEYQSDLVKARDILQAALEFDADNVENW